ncbi:MAG: ABC transporter substrate-binding protein [Acetobacteraceae bacterium]|nr:ABC transporter substrate-binding protein [Acetobacteraceae bacterium]
MLDRVLGIAAALLLASFAGARAETVLRVVPQSDLRVLDPHVTQATITRIHALMIYDQLYSLDEKLDAKPQMVGGESVSDDKLTYSFTLRPDLAFDNGQAVTTADVLASLPRAAKQDPLMQIMMKRQTGIEAVDARTFRIHFAKPFAYTEMALAAPGAFILRAADIEAAGNEPLRTTTGSGPFRFVAADFVPGARIVYDRNPHYVPRDEPADGLAGGKRVFVDRVEWDVIPDLQTKIAAIGKGEVDLIDQLPHDGVQSLAGKPDIEVAVLSPLGNIAFMRLNTLFPPFNDVRARRAVALSVRQSDYLSAAFTEDKRWWRECFSYFGCGVEDESSAGSEPYQKPDYEQAKKLLAEAGYHGERIVVLSSKEIPLIGALADVTADAFRKIGLNVDEVESDWGSLVVRRAKQEPPERGGWSTFSSGVDVWLTSLPATNFLVDTRCDRQNYVGWPCSDKLEAMRADLIDAPSGEKVTAYSRALWDDLPTILLGQFLQPVAWRKSVSGLVHGGTLAFWNVRKAQ